MVHKDPRVPIRLLEILRDSSTPCFLKSFDLVPGLKEPHQSKCNTESLSILGLT